MERVLDRCIQGLAALIQRGESKVEERFLHRPVLLHETVKYLSVRRGGVYIDGTVGEGGHAAAILQAAVPGGRLLGVDLDPKSLEHARRRLQGYEGSFTLVEGNYALLKEPVSSLGLQSVDGILLDLGLSSLELEDSGRGFSFLRDEALDMRYSPGADVDASFIVNEYPMEELADIIARYGEEPRARAIARAITLNRPLRTTLELADLVARVSRRPRGKTHPATRTFQALRIAVNSELENLQEGLEQAIETLGAEGRLVVISYHSLEDRIVKRTFAREATDCICPPPTPVCICEHKASLKIISKRVITPSEEEVKANPRSRSGRMRVAERLTDG